MSKRPLVSIEVRRLYPDNVNRGEGRWADVSLVNRSYSADSTVLQCICSPMLGPDAECPFHGKHR